MPGKTLSDSVTFWLGRYGRRRRRGKYTWGDVTERYEGLCLRLASGSGTRRRHATKAR